MEKQVKIALGSSYNYQLVKLIFTTPYLKTDIPVKQKLAHRQTISDWLKKLGDANILKPQKTGTTIYYINDRLMNLLTKY